MLNFKHWLTLIPLMSVLWDPDKNIQLLLIILVHLRDLKPIHTSTIKHSVSSILPKLIFHIFYRKNTAVNPTSWEYKCPVWFLSYSLSNQSVPKIWPCKPSTSALKSSPLLSLQTHSNINKPTLHRQSPKWMIHYLHLLLTLSNLFPGSYKSDLF